MQIGLMAKPKGTAYVSNIEDFDEPVYYKNVVRK